MDFKNNIAEIRARIDRIDEDLVRLLRERLKLARKIGRIKHENNLPVLDPDRESNLNTKLKSMTDKDLLTKKFIQNVWRLILAESHRIQQEEQE